MLVAFIKSTIYFFLFLFFYIPTTYFLPSFSNHSLFGFYFFRWQHLLSTTSQMRAPQTSCSRKLHSKPGSLETYICQKVRTWLNRIHMHRMLTGNQKQALCKSKLGGAKLAYFASVCASLEHGRWGLREEVQAGLRDANSSLIAMRLLKSGMLLRLPRHKSYAHWTQGADRMSKTKK